MSPRPRNRGNKDLEDNLYPKTVKGVTYYQWRDPRNNKYHGMGTDKNSANADAKALNTAIYSELANRRVDSVITAKKTPTVNEGILIYWRVIERRNLAENTKRSRSCILNTLSTKIGAMKLNEVTVLDCAGIINGYVNQDKGRMAQSVRSVMIDLWKVWLSEGLIPGFVNVADMTLAPSAKVKRSRLTVEDYWTIYGKADTWLKNAMLLALVTGQRREDIANMKFKDVKEGYLEIIQGKTDTGVKLNINIDLEGWTIDGVIRKCRDNIVSQYMVHHVRAYTKCKKGDPVHKDTISRAFSEARDATDLTWTKLPPTFHEIRSLSGRLHKAAGRDPKAILGHAEQKTTDIYLNTRGREWVVVG